MMDEKTVRNHFQTWESGGVDALKQRLYRGRVARLTSVQKEGLSTLLREFLIKTNVRLHFLPAYSPNLNPIERLWRFFKKKVLYNRIFF
ncbi:MAG: transposase [Planctomycetia bacterium]|nr:transposase [Planctomycetia bacterium]